MREQLDVTSKIATLNEIGQLAVLEQEFETINKAVNLSHLREEDPIKDEILSTIGFVRDEFRIDGVKNLEDATRTLVLKMDYILTVGNDYLAGKIDANKAKNRLINLKLNRVNLELLPAPIISKLLLISSYASFGLALPLANLYNAISGFSAYMILNAGMIGRVITGVYEEERMEIIKTLSTANVGKVLSIYNHLVKRDLSLDTIKNIYNIIFKQISWLDRVELEVLLKDLTVIKPTDIINYFTGATAPTLEPTLQPTLQQPTLESGEKQQISWGLGALTSMVVEGASYAKDRVLEGSKYALDVMIDAGKKVLELQEGPKVKAFTERFKGEIKAFDIEVNSALYWICTLTIVVFVIWIIMLVMKKYTEKSARKRLFGQYFPMQFEFAGKRITTRRSGKAKTRSSKTRTSKAKTRHSNKAKGRK